MSKEIGQGQIVIGVDPASKEGDNSGISVLNVTDGFTFTMEECFQQMPSMEEWSAMFGIPSRILSGPMTVDKKSQNNIRRYYGCLNARDKKRKRLLRRWRANNGRLKSRWEKAVHLNNEGQQHWTKYTYYYRTGDGYFKRAPDPVGYVSW